MKTRGLGVVAVIVAALPLSIVQARASGDPFGGYCIIQKVVLGQDDGERSTAQIWGVCAMVSQGGMDEQGNYVFSSIAPARKGYLYYFSTKAKEALSQKEWADLKALAGTGEVVGIGSSLETNRLRWADEKPQSPNEYPTQMGLWKVTSNPSYAKIVADLKRVADAK